MSSRQGFGHIGVLMGGYSSEREISLKSGRAVASALEAAGYQVSAIDITVSDKHKIIELIRSFNIDGVFIALHGRLGEDGVIQSILEEMELPFTGSGVSASQKAFNKVMTQRILKAQGLPVPEHVSITDGRMLDFKEAFAHIKKLPFVVKAACEGSSIGIYTVRHPSQWESAVKDALKFGPFVIVEKYIKGREFTSSIFDGQALDLIEIKPKSGFFDFTSKYQKGLTEYVIPAQLPDELTQEIQRISVAAYEMLGCEGFARVDMRLDETLRPYILEINTIPGFTETSLFPKAAFAAGYSFTAVCEKLLELGYGKKVQR